MLSERAGATGGAAVTGEVTSAAKGKPAFAKEVEAEGMIALPGLHEGKGTARIRFFPFDGAAAPAHFILYDLPPGASEGVHTHFLDDRNKEGAFDEYYYIISGQGQMEIDGEIVPVKQGDHVHTPLEVAHGIENTHPTEDLRVFLTFIKRDA
jgi:mannose-6-phosphate isomerase-like protein (cupin superfamily)